MIDNKAITIIIEDNNFWVETYHHNFQGCISSKKKEVIFYDCPEDIDSEEFSEIILKLWYLQ